MSNSSAGKQKQVLSIAVVVVLLLLLGGFYFWLNRDQSATNVTSPIPINRPAVQPGEAVVTPPAAAPVAEAPMPTLAPEVVSAPQHPIVPPPLSLDGSDSQVKLAFTDLAPDMAKWMVSDQQLRKWVLAIDLMADGDVPKQYRPLSIPIAHFEPDVQGVEPAQQFFMKPDGFARTNLVVTLFTAIDPDTLVQYYKAWLPILEKAYQEQGKKDTFDRRFRMALQRVIDARPLGVTPALAKRGGVIYVYADSQLESASDVEKMLWRMGPDNGAKVQAFLKQVVQRLPR